MNGSEIAIIGMAGRFPGAKTVEEFWQNVRDGIESIVFFSDQELEASGIDASLLEDPRYVKAGGVLDGIEWFDASFFGLNPREAEITDPQQRFFLECAWEALEHAGYDAEQYAGSIGVYAGAGMNTYLLFNLYPNRDLIRFASDLQLMIGNDKDFLTTRTSYRLNLEGPSVAVQTACSTSLVAVHLACQSLLAGECDMALAGGVSIRLPQKAGYLYEEGGMFSPDGHCRAFDAKGRGTAFNSGLGIVVLKRLEDALADGDHIHAIIKGSAINNDGYRKIGYTAPRVEGQARVIQMALQVAGVKAETISYVEAHGTGTALGDPAEVAALTQAFRSKTDERNFCAIGSVKTNIGHLDIASGVAGLIKTVLALEHKLIPPSLYFEQPNPQIDFVHSPFYVNTSLSEWKAGSTPRRAGVSSFGIGGTNAHVILEQAPEPEPSGASRPWQVLMLSAKTDSALETATHNLMNYLRQNPGQNPADIAYTLQVGRRAFNHRRMILCHDIDDAVQALETQDASRVFSGVRETKDHPIVFMFSGLGDQYINMGLELYQSEPTFRKQIDRCARLLEPYLGLDLRQVLYPDLDKADKALEQHSQALDALEIDLVRMLRRDKPKADEATRRLNQAAVIHPVLFALEYALAQMWIEWGGPPQSMLGYSIGEYVAACLAGVLSLEEALHVVAKRAQMIEALPLGAMLAVPLSEDEVQPYLGQDLSLSAVNGPALCVLAGTADAVEKLKARLTSQGLAHWQVEASHAMHSAMMEPLAEPLMALMSSVTLHPPQIPYLSNVTGSWITPSEATDPHYWVRHLCQTVRFADAVGKLCMTPGQVWLEMGPGQSLCSLVRHSASNGAVDLVALPSIRNSYVQQSDIAFLNKTVGQLWLAGVEMNWHKFYAGERRHRLCLPTYPFERQRYWIDSLAPARSGSGSKIEQPSLPQESSRELSPSLRPRHPRPRLQSIYTAPTSEAEKILTDLWQQVLNIEWVGIHDNFIELGGDSVLSIQIVARANQMGLALTPRQLFQYQTIAELAAVAGTALSIRAEQGIVTGPAPLTPMQHWFFELNLPDFQRLTQPVMLETPLDVKPQWLEQVLQRLLAHHDALRLRFERSASGWQSVNTAPGEAVPFTVIDLSTIPIEKQSAIIEAATTDLQKSINWLEGALIRAALFQCGHNQPGCLLLLIHHLAVDAVSQQILLQDLLTAYQQLNCGHGIQLPNKTTSFKDWACRLAEYGRSRAVTQESAYWLAEPWSHIASLPLDEDLEVDAEVTTDTVCVSLNEEQTLSLLQEVPRAYNTLINDVLLTALMQAFARWTGKYSMLINLASHGREAPFEDVDVSRTVGWFTTLFPVLLEQEPGDDPGEALKAIKEQLRHIPNQGLGYGLLHYLSDDVILCEKFRELPRAEVSLNYLGQFDQVLPEPSVFRLIRESGAVIRSPWGSLCHLLEINGAVIEGQLQLSWTYNPSLHRRSTIKSLAASFMEALQSLITHCQSPDAGGYTPSDFPRAKLSQEDIDNILQELVEGASTK